MAVSFESQSVVSMHGQCVMDAVEMGVAFAPDEFGGIKGGDDIKEEGRAAFDRLEHQIGDRPNVHAAGAPGEVTVVGGEGDEQSNDRPERNLAEDGADAQPAEGKVLRERSADAEYLVAPAAGGPLRAIGRGRSSSLPARAPGRRACPASGR